MIENQSDKESFKEIDIAENENGYIVSVYETMRGASSSQRRVFVFTNLEKDKLKKFISEQLDI